jgi:hypothetical protein
LAQRGQRGTLITSCMASLPRTKKYQVFWKVPQINETIRAAMLHPLARHMQVLTKTIEVVLCLLFRKCKSAWGPDADRRANVLISQDSKGSNLDASSHIETSVGSVQQAEDVGIARR